jgi:hypothetical protein
MGIKPSPHDLTDRHENWERKNATLTSMLTCMTCKEKEVAKRRTATTETIILNTIRE